MKSLSIGLLALASLSVFATDLELTFSKRSSQDVKVFLKSHSAEIVKAAHQKGIEISKNDINEVSCLSAGDGLGTCIIEGNQFSPNSSSRWIINVTAPESSSCNTDSTKVSFTFLDSEC